jgi:methyltransferase (TIGR00027 family)
VFFDSEINKIVASGCEQVVTLAVGFDCRCLRLPCLQAPKITHFILDQPDMIGHLLDKCPEIHDREGKGKIVPVTCKFGEQKWWDELKAKGFDTSKRTVFITEGLTMYLEEAEVQDLYEQIYKLSVPGCWVLGDYITKGMLEHAMMAPYMEALRRWKAPWTFGERRIGDWNRRMRNIGFQVMSNEALITNGSNFQVLLSNALGYIPGYFCFRLVTPRNMPKRENWKTYQGTDGTKTIDKSIKWDAYGELNEDGTSRGKDAGQPNDHTSYK